uniref:Uncharacterized protein n=3 Tax=Cacopsylla melanoneura TaxID=428564 RepID=A0A8D9EMW8_9HEMI
MPLRMRTYDARLVFTTSLSTWLIRFARKCICRSSITYRSVCLMSLQHSTINLNSFEENITQLSLTYYMYLGNIGKGGQISPRVTSMNFFFSGQKHRKKNPPVRIFLVYIIFILNLLYYHETYYHEQFRKAPRTIISLGALRPIYTKSFVLHRLPTSIFNLNTKFEISSPYCSQDILLNDRQTHIRTTQWPKLTFS